MHFQTALKTTDLLSEHFLIIFDFLEWKKMIDLDYSLELHQVNCEEYYWPGSEQRIIPCILFLANTRDRKLYAENVSTLSQMYKSLGNKLLKIEKC